MAKPKGLPKSGGRQKGTPNKNRQELVAIAEGILGRAPIEELCHYYKSKGDEALALQALKEICSYCHPKLRAVEVTGKDGEKLEAAGLMTAENVALWIGVAKRDKP